MSAMPVRVVDLQEMIIAQLFPNICCFLGFSVGQWNVVHSGRGRPPTYAAAAVGDPMRLAMVRAARWAVHWAVAAMLTASLAFA
eukprot:2807660-Pyramimonas_sp.AAC.1